MKQKRTLLTLSILAVVILFLAPNMVHANNDMRVIVDGYEVNFDGQNPISHNGYVLVPVRDVFAQMGFYISWDRSTRVATITGYDITIVIPANGIYIYVNGEVVVPAVPQWIYGGRLLLPVDTIIDIIGATITWDTAMNVAAITTTFNQQYPEYENIVTSDMLRFKYEYEALNNQPNAAGTNYMKPITIPDYNLIRYATPEEILEIASSGTGLILFGFPQCPWCRQMTPLLIDIALEKGLDVIHYIDMTTIRTTWQLQDGIPVMTDPGHPSYQDLLIAFSSVLEPMELNPFHLTDPNGTPINTGELRIFVPTVVAIYEGSIVASHVYTVPASAPGNAYGNHWHPLSDEELAYLRSIYEQVIAAIEL